ncbi:MAG: YggS family pyridoxal phosphate enzyme [Planctomycetota bacterium]
MEPAERVAANVARVRERIALAAKRAGRDPADVTLVAITKSRGRQIFPLLAAAGILDVGENRALEGIEKAAGAPGGLRWHLAGHLQTNKVRKALRLFRIIHSVDSIRLARVIDEEALHGLPPEEQMLVKVRDELFGSSWERLIADLLDRIAGRPFETNLVERIRSDIERIERLRNGYIDAFIEINSGEMQKSGLHADELEDFLSEARSLKRIRWVGLMTMAPYSASPEDARPHFGRLRELRDKGSSNGFPTLRSLSMGMSGDFEVAVEEGATHVRVGRALFEGLP